MSARDGRKTEENSKNKVKIWEEVMAGGSINKTKRGREDAERGRDAQGQIIGIAKRYKC